MIETFAYTSSHHAVVVVVDVVDAIARRPLCVFVSHRTSFIGISVAFQENVSICDLLSPSLVRGGLCNLCSVVLFARWSHVACSVLRISTASDIRLNMHVCVRI